MSFILSCPNCGPRAVDEYAYGGEVTVRATSIDDQRALFHYLYFRDNTAGDQREWWFHSSGCREWFQAERNTTRNQVLQVARPGELAGAMAVPGAAPASEAADG
ncbi:MAG: methylglutamate dehydrogenase subunit [Gaiellales bacterium]|jgi:heterotetrameric sarcosine oxidase delta subunit|nr:methylglutamate dehydrogenase subunit [Gaiellales bacterium]